MPPPATRPGIDRHTRTLVDHARQLQATQELWNLDQVFAALGDLDRRTRWLMRTTLTNYATVGVRTWPPTREIRNRRMDGDGPGLQWWPPHVSVLPPPEINDENETLFLSGAVYKWAMTVGRMTLDGQPINPIGGHGEVPHPPADAPTPDVNLDHWRQLVSDTTLDDIEDISRESGISLATLRHCYRAARSLRSGAIPWPPSPSDARRAHPHTSAAVVQHWPATDNALPPPQGVRHPDGRIIRRHNLRHSDYNLVVPNSRSLVWLWERGVWLRWAMITGRVTIGGEPIAPRRTEQ